MAARSHDARAASPLLGRRAAFAGDSSLRRAALLRLLPPLLQIVLVLALYGPSVHFVPMSIGDTIFVHLLTPDGRYVTGYDGDVLGGLLPAYAWTLDTVLEDRRTFSTDGLPAGTYTLTVGAGGVEAADAGSCRVQALLCPRGKEHECLFSSRHELGARELFSNPMRQGGRLMAAQPAALFLGTA
jgi:hypothetical protein